MKVHLMHRDRDFDPHEALPWNERALSEDLELDTLVQTMAGGDRFLLHVAQEALLTGFHNDSRTIRYRQAVLRDCLANPMVVRQLYGVVVDAIERPKREWWGISSHYPTSVLYSSIRMLELLTEQLRAVRGIAEQHGSRFESDGFTVLFAMVREELSDSYLAAVQLQLTELKFKKGILLTAELGAGNAGTSYMLRRARENEPNWLGRLLGKGPEAYTFHLADRDDAGSRILSEMVNRGISRAVVALAESADHVLSFFKQLQAELAFYIGCLNLQERLTTNGASICFPTAAPVGGQRLQFRGLYDVCLSLRMEAAVVGNTVDADGRDLVIITGANQGGKSTFLRAVGLAQLMMQGGMFVAAEAFTSDLCPAVYTHYKREEDATMRSGKFDEELSRMSEIVDHVVPNSMLLFNESFAATNEREGSEVATQIVCALLEKRIRILYVTHLYTFARGMVDKKVDHALFLRAERRPDGTRTFRLTEAEPLETSYGEDLYRKVFGLEGDEVISDGRGTGLTHHGKTRFNGRRDVRA